MKLIKPALLLLIVFFIALNQLFAKEVDSKKQITQPKSKFNMYLAGGGDIAKYKDDKIYGYTGFLELNPLFFVFDNLYLRVAYREDNGTYSNISSFYGAFITKFPIKFVDVYIGVSLGEDSFDYNYYYLGTNKESNKNFTYGILGGISINYNKYSLFLEYDESKINDFSKDNNLGTIVLGIKYRIF